MKRNRIVIKYDNVTDETRNNILDFFKPKGSQGHPEKGSNIVGDSITII